MNVVAMWSKIEEDKQKANAIKLKVEQKQLLHAHEQDEVVKKGVEEADNKIVKKVVQGRENKVKERKIKQLVPEQIPAEYHAWMDWSMCPSTKMWVTLRASDKQWNSSGRW